MKKILYIGLLYGVSYLGVRYSAAQYARHMYLVFLGGFLLFTGILNFLKRFILVEKTHKVSAYQLKQEVYVYLLIAVSLICIQPIVWAHVPWIKANIDQPTFIFLFLLWPAVWLLRLRFEEIGRLSLVMMIFIPLLLWAEYSQIAETFAIIVYLLWGALIVKAFSHS